jgi:hypothetical protein
MMSYNITGIIQGEMRWERGNEIRTEWYLWNSVVKT